MSKEIAPEVLARFKELYGRTPHHTWDEEKVLEKIAEKGDSDEDDETPPKEEKKKELKPVHTSLFIAGSGDNPARIVARDDWTGQDTKDYRESYKDRLQKAMKKLK